MFELSLSQSYPVELYVEYMDAARRPDEKQRDSATKAFYQVPGMRRIDLLT